MSAKRESFRHISAAQETAGVEFNGLSAELERNKHHQRVPVYPQACQGRSFQLSKISFPAKLLGSTFVVPETALLFAVTA
eukprot:3932167-Rhodomonas_salina.1